jgi:diketogulonate reductase-like aldo/keto reductase
MKDTAQGYRNEADLGKCFETLLPKYNLKRDDIFITTKIGFEFNLYV